MQCLLYKELSFSNKDVRLVYQISNKYMYVNMEVDTYTNEILLNDENPPKILIFIIITVCHDLKIAFILTLICFHT